MGNIHKSLHGKGEKYINKLGNIHKNILTKMK